MGSELRPDLDPVQAAMQDWRQGDVLEGSGLPLIYLADSDLLVADAPDPEIQGLHVGERLIDRLIVITQTCDIVRRPEVRPFLHVAPIRTLDEAVARDARRGSTPRFVPFSDDFPNDFADLDLVTTIEKAAVYRCDRMRPFTDEQHRRDFGNRVARHFARPALPDDFNRAVAPFASAVRGKHDKENSTLGTIFRDLYSIRVASAWGDDRVATVHLLFDKNAAYFPVVGVEPPAPSRGLVEWFNATDRTEADLASKIISTTSDVDRQWLWDRLMEAWADRCSQQEHGYAISFEVHRLDELTALDWITSDALDLDYLSDRI